MYQALETSSFYLVQVEAFTHHDRHLKQLQYLDAAAHVVLRGGHWNRVAGNVQPILKALLRYVGEVLQDLIPGLVTACSNTCSVQEAGQMPE